MAAPPGSLQDLEALILRMYNTQDAKEITQIETHLQALQRSPQGWQLAVALLSSRDSTCRFFGALTFTVKINLEGSTLSEDQAKHLLQTLLDWTVKLENQGDSKLALEKLTATLVTFVVRVPLIWHNPVSQLIHSFAVTNEATLADSSTLTKLTRCTITQRRAVLDFAAELANELDRAAYNGPAQAPLHNEMTLEAPVISQLIANAITSVSSDPKLAEDGLRALQSWSLYGHANFSSKPEALQAMRTLTDTALGCMSIPALEEKTLDIFTDLLESSVSFFLPQQLDQIINLIHNHMLPRIRHQKIDPDDLKRYTSFIVATGNAIVDDVVEQPESARAQVILESMSLILALPGVPSDDDETTALTIEFWCTYSEHVTDTIGSHPGPLHELPWLPAAKTALLHTSRALWRKMWLPPAEVVKDWTNENMTEFKSFRNDAEELFTFMFNPLGSDLTQDLIDICLTSLAEQQWLALEACLTIIVCLSDSILDDHEADTAVTKLFASSMMQTVQDTSLRIPTQVRKAVILFIGNFGSFITRHTQYIPDAVRFLFACLESQNLAGTAAKAIQELCSTCRTHLVPDLPLFITQYSSVIALPHIDPYIKEKVIGGVTAIVQALPDDQSKVTPLISLLGTIDRDVLLVGELAAQGVDEAALTAGIGALQCLTSMGKSMEHPEEIEIEPASGKAEAPSTYWTVGSGKVVQDRIMSCFSILSVLNQSGDIIEAACRVLKTGLGESKPGPFVLPPTFLRDLLASCTISTPQVESVLSTAALLITNHSKAGSQRCDEVVAAILSQSVQFMHVLGRPHQDPAISFGCLEIPTRMLPAYATLLLSSAEIQGILSFAMLAIEGTDPVPKRAALELVAKLLRATASLHGITDEARVQALTIMTVMGEQITLVLVRQIAGHGMRSDLEHVSDAVKALFTSIPAQAPRWFEGALFSDAFPKVNAAVTDAEKRRFLQQMVGLRGSSKVKEVITTFYAVCRGTVSRYA